jgi:hypothetical protein
MSSLRSAVVPAIGLSALISFPFVAAAQAQMDTPLVCRSKVPA